MTRGKKGSKYSVQVVGGRDGDTRSTIVYEGGSIQYAIHDVNTARAAAVLAEGVLVIILRRDGVIMARTVVANGQAVTTPAALEAAA